VLPSVRWDCLLRQVKLNGVKRGGEIIEEVLLWKWDIKKAMQLDVVEGLNGFQQLQLFFHRESIWKFISHLNEYQHEANRDSITSKPIFTNF